MATIKMYTFIISLSSLWVSSLSLDPAPIIHNYVTINLCDVDSSSVYSTATCTKGFIEKPTNPCHPNPCLYGGSCIPTDDRKDYCCINCPYPTGGKNCSDLTCSPDCFKVDDRVFFMYPNDNRSFSVSHLKCQAEGMTMAMMKDPNVHSQTRKHLELINANRTGEYICYWIGLNRTSESTPWIWADGTELGTYTDWATGPYDWKHCAQICSDKYAYKFTSDVCSGQSDWKFYTLCEKRFPFFLQN